MPKHCHTCPTRNAHPHTILSANTQGSLAGSHAESNDPQANAPNTVSPKSNAGAQTDPTGKHRRNSTRLGQGCRDVGEENSHGHKEAVNPATESLGQKHAAESSRADWRFHAVVR